MNSRMNRYFEETEVVSSRCKKNENLYKEINKNELDNYDIKSNATVIGDNKNEIDIENLKKILDTRYNSPKRQSIRVEVEEVKVTEEESTKEYDINSIIEKAKEKKEDNYEEERRKKIHNTQYDILKELDVEKKEEKEQVEKEEVDDLKELINTITLNESKGASIDSALDVLSDLKGNENTEVLEGLKEEIDAHEESIEPTMTETQMINSFYTSSNALKDTDFEDLDDFSKSFESNGVLKIIISVIVIAIIIGIVLLVKTIFF